MPKKKFPVPPPVQAKQKDHGMLPPKPGTVLGRIPKEAVEGKADITDVERKIAEGAGWRPGEAEAVRREEILRPEVAQMVEQVRIEADDWQDLSPIDPDTPPIEPPVPVDITEMSGLARKKAEQEFEEMFTLQDQINARRKERLQRKAPPLMQKPGAAQALAVAEKAEQEWQDSVMQDEPEDQGMPQMEIKQKAPEPEPEISSADQNRAGADITDALITCPRCKFDLKQDPVIPTAADTARYLAAVLEGKRFYKHVNLFGGKIQLVFRSLLPKETDAAIDAADKDHEKEPFINVLAYARRVEAYKLAAGIESITRNEKIVRYPELISTKAEDGSMPVVDMFEYFNNEVFTTEALRTVVSKQWLQFKELQAFLDSRAEDPDFFGSAG